MRFTSLENLSRLGIVFLAAASTCAPVLGQTAGPKFEVATVKQRVSGTPLHIYDCKGDHFLSSGPQFGNLLQWAYEIRGDANKDFTRRANSSVGLEFYEIQAKAPGPIESESQCRLM